LNLKAQQLPNCLVDVALCRKSRIWKMSWILGTVLFSKVKRVVVAWWI